MADNKEIIKDNKENINIDNNEISQSGSANSEAALHKGTDMTDKSAVHEDEENKDIVKKDNEAALSEDTQKRRAQRRAAKLARKKARSLKVVEKSHIQKVLEEAELKKDNKGKNSAISDENGLWSSDGEGEQNELYAVLLEKIKKNNKNEDISLVEKAYTIACAAHKGQVRKSGIPYITHPISVAIILADMKLDVGIIAAGLLHDVVEDNKNYKIDDISEVFGDRISFLVDGVTKLTNVSADAEKTAVYADNMKKMFISMSKNIGVLIIKLADRLHNMRTLQFMKVEKQKEKAQETIQIYSPLAQNLGISKIKVELDDLALKYLHPGRYKEIEKKLRAKRKNCEELVSNVVENVKANLEQRGISGEVIGRVKHYFSIYKKMLNQKKEFEQIYDLFAVRIIVNTEEECYLVLGMLGQIYSFKPATIKDYINRPKVNNYQSLHVMLMIDGEYVEAQIRTKEMHKVAEYGIAAHWKYKQKGKDAKANAEFDQNINTWLSRLSELEQDSTDNVHFMELMKGELNMLSGHVYCFSPKGRIEHLPIGSTPIDFAYAIHSALGNKMVGARVNGKNVPKTYQIQSGDQIDIITSHNSPGPSLDWLNIVKSSRARNKIELWFRTELKEENVSKGRALIEKYCIAKGIKWSDINKPEYQAKVMRRYSYKTWDAALAAVGHGGIKEGQIVNRMLSEKNKEDKVNITDDEIISKINDSGKKSISKTAHSKYGIIVQGADELLVRCSKCCSPIPGDEIIGYISRGRGVTIHRTDCINIINMQEEERKRLTPAEWDFTEEEGGGKKYPVEIKIYVANRNRIINDLSGMFSESGITINTMQARVNKQGQATIEAGFDISGVDELNRIMSKLRQVPGVEDIVRTSG